jgi:glycosyltransferase involved in cell wall biosynthesis
MCRKEATISTPVLSIIIPVYNGEKYVHGCLDSIIRTAIPVEYEILVVDDGSTDRTQSIVKDFPCQYINIEKSGVARARNVGIAHATGEILLFFDSDTRLTKNTIINFLEVFDSNPELCVVQGKWVQDCPSANFNTLFHLNKWSYNFECLLAGGGRAAVSELMTGCLGIRKEVFKKVGGFDENYKRAGGEEWELGFRIVRNKYLIYYYDSIAVYHNFGSYFNTVYKTYFRTINFAMLIFEARNKRDDLLGKVKNSVPNRDKLSMVYISLMVLTFFFVGLYYFFQSPVGSDKYVLFGSLLGGFFQALYLYNVKGLLYYQYKREGGLFALRAVLADSLIIMQKILATLTAVFIFYILGYKKFKI